MTRLLVTGARGFVGPHVLAAAGSRGMVAVPSRVDLLDRGAVAAEVRAVRPDAVVHLAGRHPSKCASLSDAVNVNVGMTAVLLEALAVDVPGAWVLIAGSAAQYGMAGPEFLGEDAPLAPVSRYGAVKALVERLVSLPPLAPSLSVAATRSFNHVGPGQGADAPIGAWVRQVATAEASGGGALVTGRLDVVRDLLDVRDVARAYSALAEARTPGVVNVCSGVPVSMLDVARRLLALAGIPMELRTDPSLLRSLDPPRVVGDSRRLRETTGWSPTISLDDSLRDALDEQRMSLSISPTSLPTT
jgi:GDP-4-dehydro-6-deoxy-D-mannose reductase